MILIKFQVFSKFLSEIRKNKNKSVETQYTVIKNFFSFATTKWSDNFQIFKFLEYLSTQLTLACIS